MTVRGETYGAKINVTLDIPEIVCVAEYLTILA
jgi:hypothetical protein